MTQLDTVAAAKGKTHTVYRLADGTRVPGVTTILGVLAKPALVAWANRLGLEGIEVDKYRDALADVGTIAHALIHEYLTGVSLDRAHYAPALIDRAENSFLKFLAWAKPKALRMILAERPLVSEAMQLGGTIDWYGEIDGCREVIDFKTGRAIYDEHLHQVTAYRALLEEHGYRVDAVRVLQIGRDEGEGFSEQRLTDTSAHLAIVRTAREIYRLQQQVRKARGG